MTLPSSMTPMTAMAGPRSEAEARARETAAVLPSFRWIYDAYFDFVWSSTRRLGVPVDAVDDVVQEIFVVVNARLSTVEQPASLRSWIYGVARRTVSTYHRGRRVRSARESHDPLDDLANAMQPSPLDLAVLSDEVRLLWRLLGELGAVKREVFVLAELEEMTVPEIAGAIGVPLNTAYSRLRVAREEFSEALARHEAAQEERR